MVFGIVLGVVSVGLMAWTVNLLAAFLTLLAIGFYVVVYTIMLKRSTPQNIVIGGAAGALPPVIGWAAVTGNVALPALLLFLVVFYWTPPHFWALALRIRGDYAAAGVPMLPVVRGIAETSRQIGLYTILLVALTRRLRGRRPDGRDLPRRAVILGAMFLLAGLGPVAAGHVAGGLDRAGDPPLSLLDHLPDAAVRRRRARHALHDPVLIVGSLGSGLPAPGGGPARARAREPPVSHSGGMDLTFLGGASHRHRLAYLLTTERARILIDCGMFQGSPNETIRNRVPLGFEPKELDAILVTHAHLDHCGLLPRGRARGLRGPILTDAARPSSPRSSCSTAAGSRRSSRSASSRWERRHAPGRGGRRQGGAAVPGGVELAHQGRFDRRARGGPPNRDADRPTAGERRDRRARADHRRARWHARWPRRRTPKPTCGAARQRPRGRPRCAALHEPTTPSTSCRSSGRSSTARRSRSPRACTRPSSTRATSWAPRSSGSASRSDGGSAERSIVFSGDLGRAGRADPARPDGRDRGRLRPRRVDLRRARARARGRGRPHPRRDRPAGRRRPAACC